MNAPTHLRCDNLSAPIAIENLTPALSWQLPPRSAQSAYEIRVASNLKQLETPDFWNSGRVESRHSLGVAYGGAPLASRRKLWWQVRVWDEHGNESDWAEPSWWEMALLQPADFRAQWIGRAAVPMANSESPTRPAPLLRRAFELPDEVQSARVRVCGLGYFELFVNGQRVGDHVLDPIVTQYDSRASYVTHDVGALLQSGQNAVAVMLGNGWYNCQTSEVWHFDKAPWRDYPKLWLQLEITFADGTSQTLYSDSSWRVADGPLRFDALRNGETYDARAEIAGWNAPDFDDSNWENATVVSGPGGELVSQIAPPCRVLEELEAQSITEVRPGVWVFDFGANIAGWTRLETHGASGQEMTLRHAERLAPSGEIDVAQITHLITSGEFQADRFVLSGDGDETFEPRFTYHGFQWVQVEGLTQTPNSQTLRACVVGSDFAQVGEINSSHATLNALQEATLRSYRSNFVGIPTDCPHREKNGWTGDAWLACATGLWNFEAAPAYAHWLHSVQDAQRASGQLPGIVPTAGWGYNWGSGPAWDGALIGIPWQIYRFTGDKTVLQRHFAAQNRYLSWAFSLLDGGLMRYGLGDWCAPGADATAPRDLVTTAITFDLIQTFVAK